MANWLITGGAGFIGSHLAARLSGAGDQVRVLDNLSTGRAENLSGLHGVTLTRGDIADRDLLRDLAGGVDGIFHLAARVSVPDCVTHWRAGHTDNLIGSLNAFEAARAGAQPVPVVYASSAAVYGDCGAVICAETTLPAPLSPYGADKLAVEHQARAFAHIHGVPSFGLRLFNIYGPGQRADSPYSGVIARFAENRRAGRAHELHGDGGQARDFVYVGDAVEGMCRAMAALCGAPAQAGLSNLCTGRVTSLTGLITAFDQITGGTPADVTHLPARVGDIRLSQGDPARMRALLGDWRMTPLDQGLAALWDSLGA